MVGKLKANKSAEPLDPTARISHICKQASLAGCLISSLNVTKSPLHNYLNYLIKHYIKIHVIHINVHSWFLTKKKITKGPRALKRMISAQNSLEDKDPWQPAEPKLILR